MEVQDCGSRIIETVMHVWEQKQKRWQRKCEIRNSRDGSQDVGAETVEMEVQVWVSSSSRDEVQVWERETIKIEVQVWVSRSSREWKCWCGSRNKQYKDGNAGVEAETVEMALRVSKLKQER